MYFVDQPGGPKKPANATIEIDRSDLDEILSAPLPPSSPLPISVPPPLPPEELARASFAPMQMQSMAPAAPVKGGLLPYVVVSVFIAVLALAAGALLYMHRGPEQVAVAPTASAKAPDSAAALPSASAATTATTLTIHTVELGGKPSE